MDKTTEEDVSSLDIGNLPVESSVEEGNNNEQAENEAVEGTAETSEEENKVSYSRFKNVHNRYKESERRAQELEMRLEELESASRFNQRDVSYEGKKWDTWVKLYGDSEASKEAYKDWMSEFAAPDETYIRQVAADAYTQQARAEERRISSNEQTIDDELEDLSVNVGRELNDDEQIAILNIMEEFSIKDDDDNILRLYPAEKAWNIYESNIQAGQVNRTQQRNKVASLTGLKTSGEPTASTKNQNNKDFDPRWEAMDASIHSRLK